VEQNRQYRTEQAQATKQFLEAEQKRMAADLSQKEQKLAMFLADHPEFAQDAATSASAAGASVRAAARSSATVDTGLDALERQARRLRSQLASPDPPPASAFMGPSIDPKAAEAIAAAESALADARRDLQDKQSKYTQQHPDVVEAQNKVRAALARLNQAKAAARPASAPMTETPSSPEERREELKTQLARVEAAIAAAKRGQSAAVPEDNSGESNRVVTLETQWSSLNREVNETREQHEQIQTRLFRATMVATVEASGQASQMVVVDDAYKPKRPSRRGAKRTGAIAAFVVLMVGATIALGLGLLDDRVYEERDLKKLALGPIVHVVPSPVRKGKKYG
jgi:DNA repair exonuclease SbcCD ATPase subunit